MKLPQYSCVRVVALLLGGSASLALSVAGASWPAEGTDLGWGKVTRSVEERGLLHIEPVRVHAGQKLQWAAPFPHVVSAVLRNGSVSRPLRWLIQHDASRVDLEVPSDVELGSNARLEIETGEKTVQYPDGRIVFSALDAKVEGTHAKLETHPGNHRIGFWTRAEDSVVWNYKPTRWGRYDVECAFSADGGEGTELEFEIAGSKLTARRPSTGSWYRYATLPVGRFYLAKSEPFTLRVRALSKPGAAVMNLKSVVLRPAPEGEAIRQSVDGSILLHSRDAITHSVLMRYEPQTNKLCLGYWANPKDRAQWIFQVDQSGEFEVELWQGCGKGHGGSDVQLEVGGRTLPFVVEDTGHFQSWKARNLGKVRIEAGERDLWVTPLRKQAGAVMDIHKILLKPVR